MLIRRRQADNSGLGVALDRHRLMIDARLGIDCVESRCVSFPAVIVHEVEKLVDIRSVPALEASQAKVEHQLGVAHVLRGPVEMI